MCVGLIKMTARFLLPLCFVLACLCSPVSAQAETARSLYIACSAQHVPPVRRTAEQFVDVQRCRAMLSIVATSSGFGCRCDRSNGANTLLVGPNSPKEQAPVRGEYCWNALRDVARTWEFDLKPTPCSDDALVAAFLRFWDGRGMGTIEGFRKTAEKVALEAFIAIALR